MRELNNVQTAIYLFGAIMMVVGAGSHLLFWDYAPYVFAIGALCFSTMQMLQRYEGPSITIRRLRRIMLLSDVLFLVSAFLMFAMRGNPLGLDQITYLQYVYNKWVVTLLIAAILQLYTTHRISNEMEKEAKKL